MSLPTNPMVNAGNLYINGLGLTWLTGTTIQVAPGQCRNSNNVNDIILPASIVIDGVDTAQTYIINTAVAGAGGMDIKPTAGITASTLYYVYAIGNSQNNSPTQPGFDTSNLPSALISLSSTQPTMPAGYDMFRRIGCVRTNATAAPNSLIVPFNQRGNGNDREMWYTTGLAANTVLTAGNATTFTAVDCSAVLPVYAESVNLLASVTPSAAGRGVSLRPTPSPSGVASTAGMAVMTGDVSSVVHTANMRIPVENIAGVVSFDYLVSNSSDATTLVVSSYTDKL